MQDSRARGLLMLGHAAVTWFAVVYMAGLWIIDVAAGIVLTVLARALVGRVVAVWAARAHRRAATNEGAAMSAWSHKAGVGR